MVLGKKGGRFVGKGDGDAPLRSRKERRGPAPKPIPIPRTIPFPLIRAFLLGAIAPLAVAWAIVRSHRPHAPLIFLPPPPSVAKSVQPAQTSGSIGPNGEVFYDVDELLETFKAPAPETTADGGP